MKLFQVLGLSLSDSNETGLPRRLPYGTIALGIGLVGVAWVGYLAIKALQPSPAITVQQIEAGGGIPFVVKRGKKERLLEYFIHGDSESNRVLVALHGAQTTGNLFSMLHSWAVSEKIKIVAPTLPGFGLTSWDPDLTLEEWVEDIEELLSSQQVDNFHILGTSLGSIYAAALASLYQARQAVLNVELYVAFAPADDTHDPLKGSVLKMFADMRSTPFLKKVFENLVVMPLMRTFLPRDNDVSRAIRHQWEGMASCADVIYQPWRFDCTDLVTEGRKVVIVSGRSDTAAPPHNQHRLHGMISGSTLVEYDGEHDRALREPQLMIAHLELIVNEEDVK